MERLTRQVLDRKGDEVTNTLVAQSDHGKDDVVAALLAQARHEGEDA
ncbi:hypothetical protein [Streptomyces avermitilis]